MELLTNRCFQYHDGLDYSWFIGLQFLFFSNKDVYFFQAVNVIYANRISLLLSCCLYRTISFVSFDHGKTAMALSFIIFIVSNVWSFNVLLSSGSKYAYGLYLINWAALFVAVTTSIFLHFYLRKNFDTYSELQKHQRKLSIAFFLQALLSIIFCGFPENVFSFYEDRYTLNRLIRQKAVFDYYYGSVVIRWHYMAYGLVIRSKSVITPAKQQITQ
ncbi:hypothetical protein CAEBREN_10734 [Caenorhabditis brenneri]|uniref:Uncharacterized protein n=1 Tax=Caenorhabditis brenneri TaxID=135651 RepID=G0MWG9_CAEBE|nr:hypothetical protein CAEBREN_10734 [Caenorhabditis brenneri]